MWRWSENVLIQNPGEAPIVKLSAAAQDGLNSRVVAGHNKGNSLRNFTL